MGTEETTTQEDIENIFWELSLKLIDKRVELAKHHHKFLYPWGILFIALLLLLALSIVGIIFWGAGWGLLIVPVIVGGVFLVFLFYYGGGWTNLVETLDLQRDTATLALQQKLLKTIQPQSLHPQEHYRQVEVPQVIADAIPKVV